MNVFLKFTRALVLAVGCALLPVSIQVNGDEIVVPDFSLIDVNASSPTFDQEVSPRDYLQQVSGWFFGHAT